MVRRLLKVSVLAAAGLLAAAQWPEIRRYVALRQLSHGQGHPEIVPLRGTQAYPKHPAGGAQDGTGDFDSASRGGPAKAQ